MTRWIQQLHRNQRGGISVLVLLTIWCLVALVAMLWNAAEYSVRRQHMQSAVDASAYTTAMWTARTLNQETAQNMLIAQDASADIIYRAAVGSPLTDTEPAVTGTYVSIQNELNTELRLIAYLKRSQQQLRSRLPGLITNITTQYQLLQDALTLVETDVANGTITFSGKNQKILFTNQIRQAAYAANWVQTVYVPQLDTLAQQAMDVTITDTMLDQAQTTIGDPDIRPPGTEFGILEAFDIQVTAAGDITASMQAHEQDLFQDEQQLLITFPSTISDQVSQVGNFYKIMPADGSTPHVNLPLPVTQASSVASIPHVDSIRLNHPEMGYDPNVIIDPINPNNQMNLLNAEVDNASIIYPAYTVLINGKPVTINCNTPGGWGHCWAFPIERYLTTRIREDMVGLRVSYMAPIDALRQQLAQTWAKELGLLLNVPTLPGSIPDPLPDPITKASTTIPILPTLNATDEAGQKTDADFAYSRACSSYLAAVRRLQNALQQYAGLFNRFTMPYAVPTWNGQVAAAHQVVGYEVGTSKAFNILSSYQLVMIPQWAQPGMEASLIQALSWQIYRNNSILWQVGPEQAFALIAPAATEIAEEMISRPWPYEKTPPNVPVPPAAGMSKPDRQHWFSAFAMATSTQSNAPKLLFQSLLGLPADQPIVAYAQGEAFNWMEYNDYYGGYYTEKFDEVSLNTFNSLLACPRAWRLSTIGGWNWQARLSVSDDLPNAVQNNPDFAQYLQDAGITNTDADSLSIINLH